MSTLTLPAPIAAYFASEHNPEALAKCFADDAVMNDVGQIYTGVDAIKAFMAAASAKYNAVTVPFALKDNNGSQIVVAKVSGNFLRSPVDLTFRFSLENDLIKSLEVTV